MRKLFINKKDIAKAERILAKLDEVKFGVKMALEVEAQLAVRANAEGNTKEEEARKDRLFGMLYMAHTLGAITFEEENLLSRYFIHKYVEEICKVA